MKNLFFILLGTFFLFFSCKSGKINSNNNSFYDTSSKVGYLTTDLPRYSPLPLIHENSQKKDTVILKNKVNKTPSVKKTSQKKEVPDTFPYDSNDDDKKMVRDSLKISTYEKILSEKINLINSEKKKYLLAKAEVEKNPKNKSVLHTFNLTKKNLEKNILEKKVTEDLLNKLKIKYKSTLGNSSIMANTEKNKLIEIKSPKDTIILPEETSNANENNTIKNILPSPTLTDLTNVQETKRINPNENNSTENILPSPTPTEIIAVQEVEEVPDNTIIRNLNVKDFSWEVGIKLTQILDVRPLDDFKQGHIFDAINIDINSPNFKIQILSLDKSRPIAVYSQDGVQSLKASRILQDADFSIIFNLEDGLNKWIEDGKEIIK